MVSCKIWSLLNPASYTWFYNFPQVIIKCSAKENENKILPALLKECPNGSYILNKTWICLEISLEWLRSSYIVILWILYYNWIIMGYFSHRDSLCIIPTWPSLKMFSLKSFPNVFISQKFYFSIILFFGPEITRMD